MDKHHHPQLSIQDTLTKKDVRGMELGEETKVWQEVASSEARLLLMRNMIKQQLAFADLETFGQEFNNKMKSLKFKNKTIYTRVSQPAMKAKLADERMLRKKLMRVRLKMKKDLATKQRGDKKRNYKRIINHLSNLRRETKKKLNEKYKKKIDHL